MKTLFLISALVLFFTKSIFGSGDSVQQQFPVTDPRNPNCPCHAHQKKAEEEYKRLLNKKNGQEKKKEQTEKQEQGFSLQELNPIKAMLELPVIEGEIKNTDSIKDQINEEKSTNTSTSVTKNKSGKFIFQSKRRIQKTMWRKKRFKNSYDVSGCWG